MKAVKFWLIILKATSEKEGSVNPNADKNWRFVPITGNDKLDVRFYGRSEQACESLEKYRSPYGTGG